MAARFAFGPTVVQNASSGKHTATLIFLHGLGDTGNGIAAIGQALVTAAPALSHIKFIFPTAPRRPVSMNGGMTMPGMCESVDLFVPLISNPNSNSYSADCAAAWFDIDFNKGAGRGDAEGISSSVQYLGEPA